MSGTNTPIQYPVFQITWLFGYGESDGRSTVQNLAWFNADNGFDQETQSDVTGLQVGQALQCGGPMDRVSVQRLSDAQLQSQAAFADAPGDTGMQWRNLSAAENELALRLSSHPFGAAVVHGADAWFLDWRDGKVELFHANHEDGKFSDPMARGDFDLEVVDIEAQELEQTALAIGHVLADFSIGAQNLSYTMDTD